MNCEPGTLAMVVRNTTDCTCTAAAIGTPVELVESFPTAFGPGWSFVGAPRQCRYCGRAVYGFLDADLQPIHGEADATQAVEPRQAVTS